MGGIIFYAFYIIVVVIVIIIGVGVLINSCRAPKSNANKGSIIISRAPKSNANKGSIIIRSLRFGHMQITASILGVTEIMMDNPDNFVGGIDIRVIFTNNTSKIIKYVTFTFGAVNAVGDRVECSVKHSMTANGLFTGPLNPASTSSESLIFRNMFYNASIKKVVIDKAVIEYMDGTKEEQMQF